MATKQDCRRGSQPTTHSPRVSLDTRATALHPPHCPYSLSHSSSCKFSTHEGAKVCTSHHQRSSEAEGKVVWVSYLGGALPGRCLGVATWQSAKGNESASNHKDRPSTATHNRHIIVLTDSEEPRATVKLSEGGSPLSQAQHSPSASLL